MQAVFAILAHLWGDYALQNHVMANRKLVSSKWAAIHAACYTLPFLLLMVSPHPRIYLPWNPLALAIISGTHFVIDRYKLASYWVQFYGVGVPGWLPTELHNYRRESYAIDQWADYPYDKNPPDYRAVYDRLNPLPDPAPVFLGVWLGIIVDNTFHLTINCLALTF